MMFQGRPLQKGKSVVGDVDGGGRGEYETIWNEPPACGTRDHGIYPRQLLPDASFGGSEYFEGRFRGANDENLNPARRDYVMDMKNSNRYDLNEFDLCNKLRGMYVGNDPSDSLIPRFGETSYSRANSSVSNNFSHDYPGFEQSSHGNSIGIDDRYLPSFPGLFRKTDPTNLSLENPFFAQKEFLAGSYYNGALQLHNSLEQNVLNCDDDHGENSFQIPQHNDDLYALRRQNGLISNHSSSCSSRLFTMPAEAFEDSIVLDGNPSDHRSGKSSGSRSAAHKNSFHKMGSNDYGSSYFPSSPVPIHNNYIYVMAKDQQGCRYLQRKLGEETHEGVQMLFNEIISHIVELMMDPFGNYLVQKLLEICDEEQRMQIVLMITEVPGDLVRVSLNAHGTRAVQKLIETIKTGQQISLVIMALKPGFLDLVKDPNGNHVIQHCLEQFSVEDNKFIFSAAERFCVTIATHQHGCCVMNRCIAHSVGRDRENLIAKVASNGLKLAQDAFGNYVVQYIIELKIPSVAATLLSQFDGNYWSLSTQKFSSHVIEKCLKFIEYSRPRIVHELLNVPRFDQLLQDPYANYVIKSALEHTKNTKGNVHATLKKAVNSHPILRTSPYCKKIFSHNRLKT